MREPRVTVDLETRSELDVRNVGAWRYAEHLSTEVLVMSYSDSETGEKGRWVPGEPFPELIEEAVEVNRLFEAHHVQFERANWINKLSHLCPLPRRWHDTQAVCAYRSLPLSLGEVGEEVDIPIKKDDRGEELIKKLSTPRKPLKADKEAFKLIYESEDEWPPIWENDPQLHEEFKDYCDQDVAAEETLSQTIGDLPNSERRIWILDQVMNYRGVQVDLEAVYAAKRITVRKSEELTKGLRELTNGEIQTGGQRDKILNYLKDHYDVVLPGLTQEDLTDALEKSLPDEARELIKLRQALSRASTKKLDKIIECTCNDGRLRGMFQYHGAGTGRVAGRLVQLQNLIRPEEGIDMDHLIETIRREDTETLELIYGDISNAIAMSLRGMFIAAPGKILQQADFEQIEARVLAWLADEEWKIKAFERGEPIYEKAAEVVFDYPVTKKDNPEERQVGKTCELAFGFQGGVGSWRQFDKTDKYSDEEVDYFKNQWRDKNPNIKKFWFGIEDAAIECVKTKRATRYKKIGFEYHNDKAGHWMAMVLPSGRRIWYFNVRLNNDDQIEYRGKDPDKPGKFRWISTYGGKLTNNAVQGTARDFMMNGMQQTEKANYPTVMTVHDEIVAEVKESFGSTEEFCTIMSNLPEWGEGCPVSADGWRKKRYRK